MLLFSFMKTLIGQEVVVELKNDLEVKGILRSVDQYHNLRLEDIIVDTDKYPHLTPVKSLFIRGSVVRYVQIPSQAVDTALLEDAARRETRAHSGKPIESA